MSNFQIRRMKDSPSPTNLLDSSCSSRSKVSRSRKVASAGSLLTFVFSVLCVSRLGWSRSYEQSIHDSCKMPRLSAHSMKGFKAQGQNHIMASIHSLPMHERILRSIRRLPLPQGMLSHSTRLAMPDLSFSKRRTFLTQHPRGSPLIVDGQNTWYTLLL